MTVSDNTAKWRAVRLTEYMGDSLPLGHTYISFEKEVPVGRLPAFGALYNRTLYADLYNWANEKGLVISETEWQSYAKANGGNVPYYSNGDGNTSFRVPSLKCWVKGASGVEEVGSYLQAVLPNPNIDIVYRQDVTSSGVYTDIFGNDGFTSGTYSNTDGVDEYMQTSLGKGVNAPFGAMVTNSIYGNSDTVQPPSIVGMWCIVAYGTSSNVGNVDISSVMQTVEQVQRNLTELGSSLKLTMGSITSMGSGTSFTMPVTGIFCGCTNHNESHDTTISINGTTVAYAGNGSHSHGTLKWPFSFFAVKGAIITTTRTVSDCYVQEIKIG